MNKKKSQVSAEFIGVMTIMFFIFSLFVGLIIAKTVDFKTEQQWKKLTEMGTIIASEIQLADTLSDGFSRQFWIPPRVDGHNYIIALYPYDGLTRNKTTIQISYTSLNNTLPYAVILPQNVRGNVTVGMNNITKKNSFVCINMKTCP